MDNTAKVWSYEALRPILLPTSNEIEAVKERRMDLIVSEEGDVVESSAPVIKEMTEVDALRKIVDAELKPGRAKFFHFPLFSTSRVHSNYIDCIRWWGDLLLSKSTEGKVTLWGKDELAAPAAKVSWEKVLSRSSKERD